MTTPPEATRETTIRWEDPQPALAAMPTLSDLEYLRKMRDGELPGAPIASHMTMRPTVVDEGTVTFECHPDESHLNPLGTVHGGVMCTLLDSVVGCAAHTLLPAGVGYTSIELKVNYLRPVRPANAPLTAVGRVVKAGRRVSFAEGEVTDAAGDIVATASGSLLVFPVEG